MCENVNPFLQPPKSIYAHALEEMKAYVDYQIDLSHYQRLRKIGEGAYGQVWLCRNIYTYETVAVKEMSDSDIPEKEIESFKREIEILIKCQSLFLLELVGFSLNCPFTIATAFITTGSLWDLIHNTREKLNGTQKTIIAIGIAYGMMYLHSIGVIHRDLKSPNILIDEKLLPRVADFGLSRISSKLFEAGAFVPMTRNIGTPQWMAPEQFNNDKYGPAVDVYAYGVILYELLTERVPYDKISYADLGDYLLKGNRPSVPPDLEKCSITSLMRQCWDTDPSSRPSFKEIYYRFTTCQVGFPKTSPEGLNNILKEIKIYEKNHYLHITDLPHHINSVLSIRSHGKGREKEHIEVLTYYAREGDLEKFIQILEAFPKTNLNQRNSKGLTPLSAACASGKVDVVIYLCCLNCVNMNATSNNEITPLMYAIKNKHYDTVEAMLKFEGCDVNARNSNGATALHYAAIQGDVMMLDLLKAQPGINMKATDLKGKDALKYANENMHAEFYQRLLALL